MTLETLRQDVYEANMALARAGLVVLTWGNASGVDRGADDGRGGRGVVAIKPSGVAYDALTPARMVLVSLSTGEPLPGEALRPSSDTPTHVCLYQRFPQVGGIAHTHSRHATAWAQARRAIPCYGTTHADTFHGDVPLCRPLTPDEIAGAYEWNTGLALAEHFERAGLDPAHVPGALLPSHAPFAWGRTPAEAAEHALIVEEVAALAWHTEMLAHLGGLTPQAAPAPDPLAEKHFRRKHGAGAYYGQPEDK